MAQSSIHIIVATPSSEMHNRREVKLEYVREDLSDLNESSEDKSIDQAKKEVASLYTEKTKQKLHASMKPIREGVINLNEDHTMEDVQACCRNIEKEFGIEIFQIHIHRDEGHWSDKFNKTGEWKPNLHAQVLMKWQNQATGKSFRPNKQDLSKLQDIVAKSLNMKRGKTSSIKHKTALQFKVHKLKQEIDESWIELEEIKKLQLDKEKELNKMKIQLESYQIDQTIFNRYQESYEIALKNVENLTVKSFLGIDKDSTIAGLKKALIQSISIAERYPAVEKERKELAEQNRLMKMTLQAEYQPMRLEFAETKEALKNSGLSAHRVNGKMQLVKTAALEAYREKLKIQEKEKAAAKTANQVENFGSSLTDQELKKLNEATWVRYNHYVKEFRTSNNLVISNNTKKIMEAIQITKNRGINIMVKGINNGPSL